MKVLIVDDSSSIVRIVGEMLKELSYSHGRAVDGLDAIEVLKKEKDYDVILLDWNMPNMTGEEFLQHNLDKSVTNIPIVMMTTENSPTHIKRALDLGAKEYIMKPFTAEILQEKIQTVVENE